jgi:D-alanyl-D-alanine dipeptidase
MKIDRQASMEKCPTSYPLVAVSRWNGSRRQRQAGSLSDSRWLKLLVTALVMLAITFAVAAQDQSPAGMPTEKGHFRQPDLAELVKLDPTIKLDIRYATNNNFLGRQVYPEARAFLQRPAAEALVRVHQNLQKQGYGLLVFDGYRPWAITKVFWDATPASKKNFVANPAKGSRHNRGCAVDLSLFDLKTGKEIEMPSAYDEMTERAYPTYKGGTAEQRKTRDLLRAAMEAAGFAVNEYEWWHFDYKDWHAYPILNISFDQITTQPQPKIRERKPRESPPSQNSDVDSDSFEIGI